MLPCYSKADIFDEYYDKLGGTILFIQSKYYGRIKLNYKKSMRRMIILKSCVFTATEKNYGKTIRQLIANMHSANLSGFQTQKLIGRLLVYQIERR